MIRLVQTFALSLMLSAPAFAQGGAITLPDPSGLTLLSLGLAGLVIGRRAARRRHDEE